MTRNTKITFCGAWAPAIQSRLIARGIGRVIAHELGHYLLQGVEHAVSGLMSSRYLAKDLLGDSLGPFELPIAAQIAIRRELGALAERQASDRRERSQTRRLKACGRPWRRRGCCGDTRERYARFRLIADASRSDWFCAHGPPADVAIREEPALIVASDLFSHPPPHGLPSVHCRADARRSGAIRSRTRPCCRALWKEADFKTAAIRGLCNVPVDVQTRPPRLARPPTTISGKFQFAIPGDILFRYRTGTFLFRLESSEHRSSDGDRSQLN